MNLKIVVKVSLFTAPPSARMKMSLNKKKFRVLTWTAITVLLEIIPRSYNTKFEVGGKFKSSKTYLKRDKSPYQTCKQQDNIELLRN